MKVKVKPDEFGKKWYKAASNLLKTWIHELAKDILSNYIAIMWF